MLISVPIRPTLSPIPVQLVSTTAKLAFQMFYVVLASHRSIYSMGVAKDHVLWVLMLGMDRVRLVLETASHACIGKGSCV